MPLDLDAIRKRAESILHPPGRNWADAYDELAGDALALVAEVERLREILGVFRDAENADALLERAATVNRLRKIEAAALDLIEARERGEHYIGGYLLAIDRALAPPVAEV